MSEQTEVTILTKKEKGGNRHWKNYTDKNYIGSHNLEPGEEMLLTIEKFEGEEKVTTQDGEKIKQVLYFKEEVPKMIMNITNGNTMTTLYGSHPDGWAGKQIQLYATPVKAFGKTSDAIRIRDFVPTITVDVNGYEKMLKKAKDLKELRAIWVKFPVSARNDAELTKRKDVIKDKLS